MPFSIRTREEPATLCDTKNRVGDTSGSLRGSPRRPVETLSPLPLGASSGTAGFETGSDGNSESQFNSEFRRSECRSSTGKDGEELALANRLEHAASIGSDSCVCGVCFESGALVGDC